MSNPLELAQNRDYYFRLWERVQSHEPLISPEEALAAEVMKAHPEFHEIWNSPELYKGREFNGSAEENPFLHVAMHVVIEAQLRTGEPPIVREYAQERLNLGIDAHEVAHELAKTFVAQLFKALRSGKLFDHERYTKALEAQLRKGTR